MKENRKKTLYNCLIFVAVLLVICGGAFSGEIKKWIMAMQARQEASKIEIPEYAVGDTIEIKDNGTINGAKFSTVTEVRVVYDTSQLVENEKAFQEYDVVGTAMDNGEIIYLTYPDFIRKDGTFTEGTSMLLVTVRLENIDAKRNTETDPPLAPTDDIYAFKADSFMTFNVFNSEQKPAPYPWDYYDYAGEYEAEDSRYFHLEPGESKEYTVGIMLPSDPDTGGILEDYSKIRLYVRSGENEDGGSGCYVNPKWSEER